MEKRIENLKAEMLPSNEAKIYFDYNGPSSENKCLVRLIDLETELCIFKTEFVFNHGISYWIGLNPGIALHLSDCRLEFSGDFYHEELVSFGNTTQKYIVKNRKFFPTTNGDPAFQTFSEIEVWKIYDEYGIGVEKGDVVIDIGANYGFFSIYAWKQGASKIFSIEPFPSTFNCLEKNVEGLDEIFPIQAAISNQNGEEEIIQTHIYGSNFLRKNSNYIDSDLEKQSSSFVKTMTLEKLISDFQIDRINFLKVDCEGGEIDLFQTLSEEAFRKIDKIILEYHSAEGKDILSGIFEKFGHSPLFVDKENNCGMMYCRLAN